MTIPPGGLMWGGDGAATASPSWRPHGGRWVLDGPKWSFPLPPVALLGPAWSFPFGANDGGSPIRLDLNGPQSAQADLPRPG